MTTFQDGPAKGKNLMLKRAARFLRVVMDGRGKWDALDQLTDEPGADEKIYAYEITGQPGMMHVHKRGGGGFYPIATYRFVEPQPSDAEMRTTQAWHSWTQEENERRPLAEKERSGS